MPIHREGAYLHSSDIDGLLSIGIESDKLEACVNEVLRHRVKGVFGTPTFGFKEDNLDFLTKLRFVTRVHFWDVKMRDINGIYELADLQYFCVSPRRPGIDFSRLPKLPRLKRLVFARCRNLESLQGLDRIAPNVEHLVVDSCGRVADGAQVVKYLPKLQRAVVHHTLLVGPDASLG